MTRRTLLFSLMVAGGCSLSAAWSAFGSVRIEFGAKHPARGRDRSLGVAVPTVMRTLLTAPGASDVAASAAREAEAAPAAPSSFDLAVLSALDDLSTRPGEEATAARALTNDHGGEGLKSPTKAMLLSAFVPGLGQMYGGSAKLGMVYLGIEAAGWYGFSVWRTHGFDKRRDSHGYADVHYDSTAYNSIKDVDPEGYPNRPLPYNDIVEYYEDIAKLNELIWGWDDVDPNAPTIDPVTQQIILGASQNRESYQVMRREANADLRKARNVGIGLFVNHIVSAFHAFKVVQWTNKKIHPELSGYRIRVRETRDKNGYMVVVSRPF